MTIHNIAAACDRVATQEQPYKAGAAQKVLCMMGDWAITGSCQGCSEWEWNLIADSYKTYTKKFENGRALMNLRVSAYDLIELQTVIAYPDRHGYGTAMLSKLCELADSVGSSIWLEAFPYGKNRVHIPVTKLKAVYKQFGFFPIRHPQESWKSPSHRRRNVKFKNVMLRNPKAEVNAEQCNQSICTAKH